MPARPKPATIAAYIAGCRPSVRAPLRAIRDAIRAAAPDAEETISYRIPAFRQHGMLVWFAAFERHIGMYPPIRGDAALTRAVARFAGPKGNLHFPLDRPMPLALVRRIVKHRLRQVAERRKTRRR
jgi:uncharacterized protein YdhG (YjbR/CyaY superfamily)